MFGRFAACLATGVCLAIQAPAQTPAAVDFSRDVQPLLRQNCFGCHGPAQQNAGLRLDRRSSVFKPGLRRVVPGSSQNSLLYHRLTDAAFGPPMPPTGALRPEQIATLKKWIDEGAPWPDALANEADLPPLDPAAVSLVETLRTGDRQAFLKSAARDPKLLNARGPEGSTPFMYAVLYGDVAMLERLLALGADPKARNDAKVSALMFAASNLEKTRLLVAHGADVNAHADDSRTALMIAAGHPGGAAIVKLLLDRGANPNPTRIPMSESSPLAEAALAGDPEIMRLLLDRGADAKASAGLVLSLAQSVGCDKCLALVRGMKFDKEAYTFALSNVAQDGNLDGIRMLLDGGADINAPDPLGRTPLMYAAVADTAPLETVELLLARGAGVKARSLHQGSRDTGMTALDIALLNGPGPVADILRAAGATTAVRLPDAPRPGPAATPAVAVARVLPLIQRADAGFTAKSGCISCHNNSLAAMAVGTARAHGIRVDERISAQQVKVNAAFLEHQRDELHEGYFRAGGPFSGIFGPGVLAYVLMGLDAERHPADLNTDATAMYIKSRQMPDGHWPYDAADTRPPLCFDYLAQTAKCMRALQLYPVRTDRAEYEKSVSLAAAWLAKTEPRTNEEGVWRLMGLAWAGKNRDAIAQAVRDIVALQRPDGGWSELAATETNSYATGKALVALHTAGLPVSDAAYQRGVRFLLNTQMADGTWYVKTRALALQPYFETGFPYGVDQFISDAGSSWAAMALSLASAHPTSVAGVR